MPASLNSTLPPAASSTISASASSVISALESISAITGVVSVLFVRVAVEVAETSLELPPLLGKVNVLDAASECGAPISVCA